MKSLSNLLKTSTTVSDLSVIGVTKCLENFLSTNFNFKFQLNNLKIDSIEGKNVNENSVVNFLNSQAAKLKTLVILKQPESENLQNLLNSIQNSIKKC